jgi:hypothetical protein
MHAVWSSEVRTKPGISVAADLPSTRERDQLLLRWREERVADLARRPPTSPYPPVDAHHEFPPAESRRETRRLRARRPSQ